MNIPRLHLLKFIPAWLTVAAVSAAAVHAEIQAQSPQVAVPKVSSKPSPPPPTAPVDPNMYKRFLVVNLSAQRVDLYENGSLTFSTPASSGREEKPTKEGVYTVTDKHEKWVSTLYNVPMPHFLRLNGGDMGLHAGPLPGYPGSAGCVRLPESAAEYLFDHIPVGTHVLIQGQAPDIEWIKEQYRKRGPQGSTAVSKNVNSRIQKQWQPPYPVIHTSWSNPATTAAQASNSPAPKPNP